MSSQVHTLTIPSLCQQHLHGKVESSTCYICLIVQLIGTNTDLDWSGLIPVGSTFPLSTHTAPEPDPEMLSAVTHVYYLG